MTQTQPEPKKARSPYIPTLVVLGVFGALLAYVLLVEVKREPKAAKDATPTPLPILNVETGTIKAVGIARGERTLRLERQGTEWRILGGAGPEGSSNLADNVTVSMSLDDLAHLEASMVVLEQVPDPAAYGLNPPSLALTLELESGQELRINVGRETPDRGSLYAQRAGDPRLYLVSQYRLSPFFEWLAKPPYPPTPTPRPPS